MGVKVSTLSITVATGAQSFVINSGGKTDANLVCISATSAALNGTGSDLDFFSVNVNDIAGTNPRLQVGATLSLTPALPRAIDDGTLSGAFLLLDFEPNDATLGTITITVTFKS